MDIMILGDHFKFAGWDYEPDYDADLAIMVTALIAGTFSFRYDYRWTIVCLMLKFIISIYYLNLVMQANGHPKAFDANYSSRWYLVCIILTVIVYIIQKDFASTVIA